MYLPTDSSRVQVVHGGNAAKMTRLPLSERRPVVVIGAGIAGLVATFELASRSIPTVLLEAADRPGGKMRRTPLGAHSFDGGPTVLTMRWVFDELFADAGLSFAAHVATRPAEILARHAWPDGSRLDLHADAQTSAQEIGRFAGREEGERFLRFCDDARATYRTLEHSFIRGQRPSMPGLVRRIAARRAADLASIRPFETLWSALGRHFRDPRLRQLFGRYATYCGSSPFDAPATLMLVAHVEQAGVWLVDEGMFRIAEVLEELARGRGAQVRYASRVASIRTDSEGACGVELEDGEFLPASAVIAAGDSAALARGLLGRAAVPAARQSHRQPPSLSAMTWLVGARPRGFPLVRHNVFFSADYRAEFDALIGRQEFAADPTIYLCAQDRGASAAAAAPSVLESPAPGGDDAPEAERIFVLVNAPAIGDRAPAHAPFEEIEAGVFRTLGRFGLALDREGARIRRCTPADFARLYPGRGGALYGAASHGWRASFQRPGSSGPVPRLYLAGGSVHPGPGVPMAAISGRLAAARVLEAR